MVHPAIFPAISVLAHVIITLSASNWKNEPRVRSELSRLSPEVIHIIELAIKNGGK